MGHVNYKQVTIAGNLTADPELKSTQNGTSVLNLSVAVGERKFNRDTDEWEDGETLFIRGTAWRDLAEHIDASAVKGSRVIVVGELKPNSYEKDGVTVNTVELDIQDFGVSLQRATAKVTKVTNQSEPEEKGSKGSKADKADKAGKVGKKAKAKAKPAVDEDDDDDDF